MNPAACAAAQLIVQKYPSHPCATAEWRARPRWCKLHAPAWPASPAARYGDRLLPAGQLSNVRAALQEAHRRGLLALGLAGGDGEQLADAELDFCFVARARDPLAVQGTREMLHHILWELVHIFNSSTRDC
jgi:hypothetical protein